MKELFTSMLQALSDGQSVVLCSILASSGSTPRGAGANGRLRRRAYGRHHRRRRCRDGSPAKRRWRFCRASSRWCRATASRPTRSPDIGMICGGNVTVFFQYFDPAAEPKTALLQGILELLRGDEDSWLVYRMDGGCVSAMGTFDEAHGLRFTDCITPEALRPMLRSNAFTKKGDPRYYIEPLTQGGHAYIFGGGHVGTALAPVLASVGFRVVIYDNRPGFAKPDHYPPAEQVILGDYLDIGAHLTLTENDYVCIMTPGHQADREVLLQAPALPRDLHRLHRQPPQDAATNAYLMANGIPEADLARVHAPIGLEILRPDPGGDRRLHRRRDDPPPALRSGTAKKPSGGGVRMHVFLTGPVQIGKSTLLATSLDALQPQQLGGFRTVRPSRRPTAAARSICTPRSRGGAARKRQPRRHPAAGAWHRVVPGRIRNGGPRRAGGCGGTATFF